MTAMEWATIASLATAVGTLVLAVATFASVRSANYSARAAQQAASIAEQSARIAERSLEAAERPLLMSSRLQDPEQKIQFQEGRFLRVAGGTLFTLRHANDRWLTSTGRHFNVDRPDPR